MHGLAIPMDQGHDAGHRTGIDMRLHGRRPNVHFGEYEIPTHASPAQILEIFEQGRVVLEQLTVVEGSTFADCGERVRDS